MENAPDDIDVPSISAAQILERQANERQDLKKRHDRIRSSIPKKDRNGRLRAAEGAELEEHHLLAEQAAEREEYGMTTDDLRNALDSLSLQQANEASQPQSTSAEPKAESKAARRRRKKAEQEAEAQRRVEEKRANMGPSARFVELEAISEQLKPKNLSIHPIAADGHCLYRAVGHQMETLNFESDISPTVESLRGATADYLLAHQNEFMPFLESLEGDEQRFKEYCEELRNTAVWGGQVELNVLSKILGTVIEIYIAHLSVVRMGESTDPSMPVLKVSFHRHYLGLGEHYNSVVNTAQN